MRRKKSCSKSQVRLLELYCTSALQLDAPLAKSRMLQRNSALKRKRTGDLDVEIKCYMVLQPAEKDEFFQSIKQLYESESLCDVSIKVGGQLFPVHRVILAAANR